MKKNILFLIGLLLLSTNIYAQSTSSTGYGKSSYIRAVVGDVLSKQEISSDSTFDSDSDNLNLILKAESSSATTQGNTLGIISKGYYSNNVATGNSEIVGGASWIKNTATQGGGSKSAIHTFHVHSDSTTTVDRGLAVFGDTTSLFYASGTNTNFAKLVTGNEGVSAGSTKSTPSTVDMWLVVEIKGTTYYAPLFISKTS